MSQESVVQIQNDPRATIATILCRDFDYHGTNQFKAELAGATGGDSKLPLILDMSNVGFMPSVTLGALIELRNRLAREQRTLTLVGIQPAITKLMQASGILNLFSVRTNLAEAMN